MASGRHYRDVQGLDVFEENQSGSFLPQGTSAPLIPKATNGRTLDGGGTWSVTRTGVGKFLLVLKHPPALVKSVKAKVQMASFTNLLAQVGAKTTVNGKPAWVITVYDGATAAPTDIAADVNNAVHWRVRTASAISQITPN